MYQRGEKNPPKPSGFFLESKQFLQSNILMS
jgi:hypothetical protein